MKTIAGLYPPIATPFDDRGQLSVGHLEANLQKWVAAPLDGIVTPGSNSESAYLTHDERQEIWGVCARALAGTGKRLIAGTGVETTAGTIELCQRAADTGAEAVLVQPPHFFKGQMNHEALVAYFEAVADGSPAPVLLYNAPAFTGIDLQVETITALAAHNNIVGVKDSGVSVVRAARVLAAVPDFLVFSGTGSALVPFLSLGGAGGIMALANIAPAALRELHDTWVSGDTAGAAALQIRLAEINTAITSRYGVPGLKHAMERVGLYGGSPRAPLRPLTEAAAREIDRLIDETNIPTL